MMGRLDLVRWMPLPSFGDERGMLTAIESGIDLPFEVKRIFFVHHIRTERGGHAHRDTHELVVAVSGRCELVLSDGAQSRSFILESPTRGVLLGPMLFIQVREASPDAVIAVLASTHFEKSRSIYSWAEFVQAAA